MSAPAPQPVARRADGPPASNAPGSLAAPLPSPEAPARAADGGPQRPSKSRASAGDAARRAKARAYSEGEKLVVRQLPPGMTEAEFVDILGLDWEVDKGRVDWFSYCPGKVAVDPTKPSRPSRAYLHLMRKDDIMALSQAVRGATWEDAKSSFTSPSLIGPPALEFSTYKKIPSNKRRTDPRQGTIDQDQEFMDFLEGLANPALMRESIDDNDVDEAADDHKITTTPLVEFLKEKRASKCKDGGVGKSAKSGSAKGKGSSKDDDSCSKKSKADKADKAGKEQVTILTKKAATEQAAEAARNAASQITAATAAGDGPKSRRASIAAAARILQRDLGLSPGSAHRRARHDAAKAEANAKVVASKEPAASANEAPGSSTDDATAPQPPESPVAPKPQPAGRRNRGGLDAEKGKVAETAAANPPVMLRKKGGDENAQAAADAQPESKQAANGKANVGPSAANTKGGGGSKSSAWQKKAPAVTAGATRAFVKHANQSQGVTEPALRQALEAFGAITLVEVDKRKGFAYVDFAEHDSLVKAVGSSPVQVAQTAVQVVERKDKRPAAGGAGGGASGSTTWDKASSGRGRRGRGGGGGKANGAASGPAGAPSTSTGGSR